MAKKYDASRRPGETPLQHYRRIAKVADQRLVRLEKLSSEQGYKNVLKWSYKKAQKEINYYTGKNQKIAQTSRQLTYMKKAGVLPGRFNTKPPETNGKLDINKLEGKIARIQEFLERPTSAKGTITEVYRDRAKTLNQKWYLNLKWQDLADFFESDAYKNLAQKYGSDTILTFKRTVDSIPASEQDAIEAFIEANSDKSEEELAKLIKENSEIHFDVYDENGDEDEVAMNFIIKELASQNLSIFDLKN